MFLVSINRSSKMRVKTTKKELNNSSDEEQVNALRPVWQGRWFLVKTYIY